jgi:hypothetical protein
MPEDDPDGARPECRRHRVEFSEDMACSKCAEESEMTFLIARFVFICAVAAAAGFFAVEHFPELLQQWRTR